METASDTSMRKAQTTDVGWVKNAEGGWSQNTPDSRGTIPDRLDNAGEWVETGNGWARSHTPSEKTSGKFESTKTQLESNRELLASSELGVLLLNTYDAAVEADPRLADIIIVPYSAAERGAKGSAFARGADISESGKQEIHIRLNNLDASLELMQETLEKVPGLRELIAEKLLLDNPSELTALQLHTFVMLHEMGHLVEFMNYEGRMPELRKRQRAEKDALPLGNVATSALIDPTSVGGKYVRENWKAVSSEHGVSSIAELAEMKNNAHRNMTSETFADNFAAHILIYEPTLLDQLGSGNIEYYRDYKAA